MNVGDDDVTIDLSSYSGLEASEPPEPPEPPPVSPQSYRGGSSFIPGLQVRGFGGGRVYRPFDGDRDWARLGLVAKRRELGADRGAVLPSIFVLPDGSVPDTRLSARIVARLLDQLGEEVAPVYDPTAEGTTTRAYIPGLWNHETTPAFVGPKGWGKTRFLAPLAASLIVPERRFLGYFEPAEVTEAERERDVWMINPETRPGAVHEELIACGLVLVNRAGLLGYASPDADPRWGILVVEHLRKRGGAAVFDLTEPERAAWWETRLIEYGDRPAPPRTMIVDGVTAILRNNTARYGAFTSALRELLDQADIPTGLGVLHSPMSPSIDTPMGGIESMGEWDGIWMASASRFPIKPETPRHFQTAPRMGDPEVPKGRLVLDDDGLMRLVAAGSGGEGEGGDGESDGEQEDSRRLLLLDRLAKVGAAGAFTKAVCGEGEDYMPNKAMLEQLQTEGIVASEQVQKGRIRGTLWRLIDGGQTE